MASRLLGGDIIVFHEYFDSVIRSKCCEFLNRLHAQAPLIINSSLLKKEKKVYSMQMCWYGIIRMSFASIFLLKHLHDFRSCPTDRLQTERKCMLFFSCCVQLLQKIYLARRDNGSHCDVKEACIYKKKQRGHGCQPCRTLIRLFLSFSIHTLYQPRSSSFAFANDMDQMDLLTLSHHLQVRNVIRAKK